MSYYKFFLSISITIIIICSQNIGLHAQRNNTMPEGTKKDADTYFFYGSFQLAYDYYKTFLRKDSRNIHYNLRIGQCILELNMDKEPAIHHLEYVIKNDTSNYEAYFYLGLAYRSNYRFNDAIDAFQKYINYGKLNEDSKSIVTRNIEMCENAKVLIKDSLDVTFENLGKTINTENPEYNPFITEDESIIIYNTQSKPKDNLTETLDGFLPPDVYMNFPKNGKWDKKKNIGRTINSADIEEIVGLSPNGKHYILYKEDWINGIFDEIWYGFKKGKSYKKPIVLDKSINSTGIERTGCISNEGDIIFFSSTKSGGKGENDIYMSKKLPNELWGDPINLEVINTEYNEEYPYISGDGKYLYFASEGHNSMGGFDIFRSEYDKDSDTWSQPQNIGYPINTVENNKTISFDKTGKFAYVSAFRKGEGFGHLDIYKVIYNKVEPKKSLLHFNFILGTDTISKDRGNLDLIPEGMTLTLNKSSDNSMFGIYTPGKTTGTAVVITPAGNYEAMVFDEESNIIGSSNIEVYGLGNYKYELFNYITISPKTEEIIEETPPPTPVTE